MYHFLNDVLNSSELWWHWFILLFYFQIRIHCKSLHEHANILHSHNLCLQIKGHKGVFQLVFPSHNQTPIKKSINFHEKPHFRSKQIPLIVILIEFSACLTKNLKKNFLIIKYFEIVVRWNGKNRIFTFWKTTKWNYIHDSLREEYILWIPLTNKKGICLRFFPSYPQTIFSFTEKFTCSRFFDRHQTVKKKLFFVWIIWFYNWIIFIIHNILLHLNNNNF